ncbi:MAG: (d)CMP kinase [Deltaproteobacteria bacterium]|nr:(d)CMP kinase [Deltaproteobacteria bacterium]
MSVVNVITIDGPAGSGKSTVSRQLAARIDYAYLDTGAMYRAVALAAKRGGISVDDRNKLAKLCGNLNLRFVSEKDPPRLYMDNEDISEKIRNPEIDMLSSNVSAVKEVRDSMCDLQRKISCNFNTGLVAEGRDMGTVVFPDARFKFMLTASLEERASRRHLELLARGKIMEKNTVMNSLKKRDDQDENRTLAPLKPARDAVILDSTGMGIEDVVQYMMNHMGNSPLLRSI